jgi:hypothetical protein
MATELLARDAENKSFRDNYTPEDVMNAGLIFQSIISNYGIKQGMINGDNATKFGEEMAALIKLMTGVNTKTYYK